MKKVLLLAVLVATLVAGLTLAEGPKEAAAQYTVSEDQYSVSEEQYTVSEVDGLLGAAAQGGGMGQFKGQCTPSLPVSRNDPIVKPYTTPPTSPEPEYKPSAHKHVFWGNVAVPSDATVDTWEEMDLKDTTCEDGSNGGTEPDNRKDNKSAYWMPQPYINGYALTPHGSGFYYSSKAGLNPTKTMPTPKGLKLIAKHRDHHIPPGTRTPDPREAAEIDIACPAGSLIQAQRLPDGVNSTPLAGACQRNGSIDIAITFPECLLPRTAVVTDYGERVAYRAINRGQAGAYCASGQRQIPTLQEFFTFKIPDIDIGSYAGDSSLGFAGPPDAQNPDGTVHLWPNIHGDYFNAEDHVALTDWCINKTNSNDVLCK